MAKTPEPVSDLYVGNQAAMFYLGAQEVNVFPGLVVHRDSAIREARPSLFDPLVLALADFEDEPGTATQATVLVISATSDGLGHGTEMTRVNRFRTRPALEWMSS